LRLYLETSAAAKLLLREAESAELEAFVGGSDDLVATVLLETEMLRVAQREGKDVAAAYSVLDIVTLHELSNSAFTQAGLIRGRHLRSLDALHIVGALRTRADAILAYDRRVIDAAKTVGLRVFSPGA
jgi:predicted nucleic acid-binding protein